MVRSVTIAVVIFLVVALALPLHFWLGMPWWLSIGLGALFTCAIGIGLLFWVLLHLDIG